jgi:hypothetical protein
MRKRFILAFILVIPAAVSVVQIACVENIFSKPGSSLKTFP